MQPEDVESPIGPGAYNVRSSFEPGEKNIKGYTMGERYEIKDRSYSPGPAAYSL